MNSWNGFDFFVFLIFFINTMLGIVRGASREIVSFMCLSVGLIFMIKFTIPLTNWLISSSTFQNVIDAPFMQNLFLNFLGLELTPLVLRQFTYSISLLVCFAGAFTVGEAALSKTGILEVMSFPYATLNRKVGGALGFVRGYVLAVILMLITHLLLSTNPMRDSFFMNLFSGTIDKFEMYIGLQNPENYRRLYDDKNIYRLDELYRTVLPDQKDLHGIPTPASSVPLPDAPAVTPPPPPAPQ